MKNLLLLSSSYDYEDDIDKCKSFTPVLTFFLKKYLIRHGYVCEVVATLDSFRHKQFSSSNYETFKSLIIEKNIHKKYDNVLIVGINPLKKCDPRITDFLKNNFKGKILTIDETNRRPPGLPFICAFMISNVETDNSRFIGQGVDKDYLYPEKNNNELIIHVDHSYPKHEGYFPKIVSVIKELEDKKIYKKYGFHSLKVFYHSEEIDLIDRIHKDYFPPNISFSKLSKIYRQCHFAFISHRESMGNYPLELAATGSVVITPDISSVQEKVINQISYILLDEKFNWEHTFQNMKKISEENVEKSNEFSFDKMINRIDKILGYN